MFCFGVQVFVCMFLRVSVYITPILMQNNYCYKNQVATRRKLVHAMIKLLAPNQPQWNPSLFQGLILPSLHASSSFCIKKQEVGKAREPRPCSHLGRCVSDTVLVTGGLTAGFCMCPSSPLLLGSSKFIDHNHRNKQLLKVMSLSPWFPIMKGIVHSRY